MNEENNQDEDYVEEEIEVYEEVEVDEEEETNDKMPTKQKSKNKLNIINNNTISESKDGIKTNLNNKEKKEENINDNKLLLLSDIIKNENIEIKDNNNINGNKDEKIDNIPISNNDNDDLKNNFFFDSTTEENKYLNLDYKILPEKDNQEFKNNSETLNSYVKNDSNLNQSEVKNENKSNQELNNEINKNTNSFQQSNNFRSKIKRNNKKIHKFDNNIKNNINNIAQENIIKNDLNIINATDNKIELNQNSEIQIKTSLNLINKNNEDNKSNDTNIIQNDEQKENKDNNENLYDIINNNINLNLDKNNNDNITPNEIELTKNNKEININKEQIIENETNNKENNLNNNEENKEENNKNINKKTKEEEKYEYIMIELLGNNEIIELFESKKWEEKKQGFQKLNQFLNENFETDKDIIKINFENFFIFISLKLNNFKETNFNLLKEGIICLNILFSYAKEKNIQLNKKYLETIITNLNEKICDTKIKDNYIQLLNTLIDLYSSKIVYELLFDILLKTNKINILKEYSLFIKNNIKKENSINNFDLKNLIDFSVKIANNTNPQLRSIAIEIIGLLYTFIGPDLKHLISGIKEYTLKLIEKEIDKIKYNKNNENKVANSKIKDLIVKKNKNNSEKNNENILNNKRIDISKELTPKLLREINRGKWIEKKEGIEYINSIIDNANNKISKNGLQELFELIKDKLNDGNQNFVKMILQLLNHLIISLEGQIKFFYNNLVFPLLLKLSDKNKLIRDECLTCIENWIKNQNFEIFAVYIPQLLNSNENLELRTELLNLLIKNKALIKNTYPKDFFKELTQSFLTCLQDRNIKIRNLTEELITNFINFISREKYVNELKDIKSTISDYLYNIIDKLLPKLNEETFLEDKTTEEKEKGKASVRQSLVTYDTNNDKDIILVSQNFFSPKKVAKNKNKTNKNINSSLSLDKNSYMKNEIYKKRENKNEKNSLNQTNQMNSTVCINSKRNKIVKNIKSKLMGYDKLSTNANKKNNNIKYNTINIKTELNSNKNKIENNTKAHHEIKKIKPKERNSSMIIDNKNSIILTKKPDDTNKKELKSLTAEKLIKNKKVSNNNYTAKNESFIKRQIKKVNPKKFININGNDIGKNKVFLPNYKIKKGVKEKRYEKDKKNNYFLELQNFDCLPKIKETFKNIFTTDFITKFFSNDLRLINQAISQLKNYINESLNSNNEENLNKLIDNLDMILKVIASKIYNNQTASLIKTYFIFEINILLNTFVDKLSNSNAILKETACNLIWFLNDQIDSSKTFITLIHLLEYKNAKLKTEIIDIIIKLFEKSDFDIYIYTKVLKNIIREYFEADFNSKKKILFLLQNIYNIIGNEFWKYTIFLSSKDRDELENNIDIQENDINNNNSSKEYEIDDFSGSGFGEEDLIDNNNLKKKKINNTGVDLDQEDMQLHIKYFKEEDNKNNNNKNYTFKRSITDNAKLMQKKEDKESKVIDKNNFKTNIPTNNNISENTKENSNLKSISEKELFEALDMLMNPEEDLVEAIISIHCMAYRNYTQNKKILNQNADKIISSFTEIIIKLFSSEPLRIKIIKYCILVLCKLCNNKEFITNISLNTQKNLIILVLTNLLRENLNTLGENGEGMDIWKSLNSIITHIIEYCDITKNIEIIIDLEKKFRKEKNKLAEYSARCLIIITQNVKNLWNVLDYQKIFGKIHEMLMDFIDEDNQLQPKERTDQTILITLRNLVNEITKAKKENILDDYNQWIKQSNINNEKYILNWIKEFLNRINIHRNLSIEYSENNDNNKNNNNNDDEHIIIGNNKKSLNEIKKKCKDLQEKQNDS